MWSGLVVGLLTLGFMNDGSAPSIPLIAREAPCALRGMQATCSSIWSQGLHPTHFKQHYQIRAPETGARFFEGIGTYRIAADGSVDGVWADSNGNIHPLDGTWDGRHLRINWGTPETEQGRSEYHFDPYEGLRTTDWVLGEDNQWHQFMTVTYPNPH